MSFGSYEISDGTEKTFCALLILTFTTKVLLAVALTVAGSKLRTALPACRVPGGCCACAAPCGGGLEAGGFEAGGPAGFVPAGFEGAIGALVCGEEACGTTCDEACGVVGAADCG